MTARLMPIREAAGYLGLTEGALRKLVERRGIPFVRIGKRAIRLDVRELDRWIADNTSPAVVR
jgi:excisionase family DNA binding protein